MPYDYIPQEDTTCDVKISTYGGIVVKAQYTNFIQDNSKCYWEQIQQQNNIIVTTRTIVRTCLNVLEVTDVKQTPNSVCNRNHAHKVLQRHHICLTDSGHDFILDEIQRRDNIEYDGDMTVEN